MTGKPLGGINVIKNADYKLHFIWLVKLEFVFQELRPPMKMLVPIWKALCAATGSKGSSDTCREDG